MLGWVAAMSSVQERGGDVSGGISETYGLVFNHAMVNEIHKPTLWVLTAEVDCRYVGLPV